MTVEGLVFVEGWIAESSKLMAKMMRDVCGNSLQGVKAHNGSRR